MQVKRGAWDISRGILGIWQKGDYAGPMKRLRWSGFLLRSATQVRITVETFKGKAKGIYRANALDSQRGILIVKRMLDHDTDAKIQYDSPKGGKVRSWS